MLSLLVIPFACCKNIILVVVFLPYRSNSARTVANFLFLNEHEEPIKANLTIAKSLNFDEISLHPNTRQQCKYWQSMTHIKIISSFLGRDVTGQ